MWCIIHAMPTVDKFDMFPNIVIIYNDEKYLNRRPHFMNTYIMWVGSSCSMTAIIPTFKNQLIAGYIRRYATASIEVCKRRLFVAAEVII